MWHVGCIARAAYDPDDLTLFTISAWRHRRRSNTNKPQTIWSCCWWGWFTQPPPPSIYVRSLLSIGQVWWAFPSIAVSCGQQADTLLINAEHFVTVSHIKICDVLSTFVRSFVKVPPQLIMRLSHRQRAFGSYVCICVYMCICMYMWSEATCMHLYIIQCERGSASFRIPISLSC